MLKRQYSTVLKLSAQVHPQCFDQNYLLFQFIDCNNQSRRPHMWLNTDLSPLQRRINSKITVIRNLLSRAIKEYNAETEKALKSTSPSKRKSDESSEAEEVAEVIKDLKKGYIMTKHSNDTQSKTKFVYLSMNERYLCWKSVDKKDEKRIEICTISRVVRDVQHFLKKMKRVRSQSSCVVIIAEERILILEAMNQLECQLFEEDILRAIKYCRKMSLNYHYLND